MLTSFLRASRNTGGVMLKDSAFRASYTQSKSAETYSIVSMTLLPRPFPPAETVRRCLCLETHNIDESSLKSAWTKSLHTNE